MHKYKVVLIGASSGGVAAFQSLLGQLPETFPLPIVAVHHLPAQSKINPKLVYGGKIQLQVGEIQDKQKILPGYVYFAPADYHLLIEKDLTLSFDASEPVNFSRPSIDVTFLSAAESLGSEAIAILLTGANHDGSQGIAELQAAGALTLVQDPQEAESPRMPESAIAASPHSRVATIEQIVSILIETAGVR